MENKENNEELIKIAKGLGRMYADLKDLEAKVDVQIEDCEEAIKESESE